MSPEKFRVALDAALPRGLDVLEVAMAPAMALAVVLTGSLWGIDLIGISSSVLDAAVDRFLAESEVKVECVTKTGLRALNARASAVAGGPGQLAPAPDATLHTTVRPEDVLAALGKLTPELRPSDVPILTRLEQGSLDPRTGVIHDPT